MMNFLRILFAFSLLPVLAGCSIPMDFFVVNKTGDKATLIIKFSAPLDYITKNERYLQLKYVDTILPVNNKTHRSLSKQLSYTTIDDRTISVEIPGHSTVLVGGRTNGPLMADSLTFISNQTTARYSIVSLQQHTHRTRSVVSTIHFTYTINN